MNDVILIILISLSVGIGLAILALLLSPSRKPLQMSFQDVNIYLETLITNIFNDHTLKKYETQASNKEPVYINDESYMESLEDVAIEVNSAISPSMRATIALYFDEKYISIHIAKIVEALMLEYCTATNRIK